MKDPIVTIVVTQRERFSYTITSLESIYKNTSLPFKLIYIDGGSPSPVKNYLAIQAVEKGFKLIRAEHFIPSSKARNLAQTLVNTKYIVFIDNDVSVTPGWLEALVKCAEETQAWVVGPTILEGKVEDQIIHTVGEEAHFKVDRGQRTFHGPQRFTQRKLAEVQNQLRRDPVECVELHCMLVCNAIFETLGPLDENFVSLAEHQDLCLAVSSAGGSIYLEPDAIVAFPHLYAPLKWSDLAFFYERWSEARAHANINHIRAKWNLSKDAPWIRLMSKFSKKHRRYLIRRWFPWQQYKFGRIALFPLGFIIESFLSFLFTKKNDQPKLGRR